MRRTIFTLGCLLVPIVAGGCQNESEIVVVGYSLGSGMAAYLAANNDPQQLILLAPYYSMAWMKNRFLPFFPDFVLKYPLRTDRWLAQVNCPVTLVHGTRDEVIPYRGAEMLRDLNPEQITLVTLDGESHRGAIFNPVFSRTVAEALR